ncbi:glycosyltransferase family 9 protein [Aquabacterium sp. A7-Y]|uniref:glycosyltransferase family 9 protein n=1 Tax=Aquabacterium sp. A7-Y TaxID=1349605 RepID=UPI00223E3235|nr:glycosyltransferase family 9 protein [Aquabacterium sp. A7-Y]MCW7536313.1 glycosyltransferase family 9 protein [Aquabacterium sp. A7-Y]
MPPPRGSEESVRERWGRVRRLLAVRLDNLGDVLMTTPALAAVRRSLPGVHLSLLCSRSGAAARPHLADVDDAIVYDAPWSKGSAPRDPAADRRLLQQLEQRGFDAAVIFTVYTQSALPAALMCRLAGIPLRLAHSRENPYELLSDWVPDPEPAQGIRHEVERQLALVAAVGLHCDDDRLRFACREADAQALSARLAAAGIGPQEPLLVVHPGATAASRRYPAAHFGLAAERVARDSGLRVVFTGGADEAGLVAEARSVMQQPSLSLAGLLSLGEFAALLRRARVLLSNNSGPVHIAAALGTPVVDLYALTNPQHTPWRVPARVLNHDVPCRNCLKSVCPQGHNDCLRKVEPQQVADATLELLAESGAAPALAPLSSPPIAYA